jgi:WXG100 family type VII secretion target
VTDFHIDLPLLDSTTQDLARFDAFIDHKLGDLDRVVEHLHVTWTGQAAAAHAQAHREWRAGADRMREGLLAMRTAARVAHDNYHAAATANQAMWRNTT